MYTEYSSIIMRNLTSQPMTPSEFINKHKQLLPKGCKAADISSSFRHLHKRGSIDAIELSPEGSKRVKRAYFKKAVTKCSEDSLDRLLQAVAEIEAELRTLRQMRDLAKTLV